MSIRWRSQSEIQLHTSMVRPFSMTRESSIEIERGREKTVVLQLVIISVKVVLTIPLTCCDWMYRIFFYWNNLNFWHLNCLKKKKRNVECCEWTVPFIFSLSKHYDGMFRNMEYQPRLYFEVVTKGFEKFLTWATFLWNRSHLSKSLVQGTQKTSKHLTFSI